MSAVSVLLQESASTFSYAAAAARGGAQSVSVVVPVLDGGAAFRQCLEALARAAAPSDEIIVVVDGPDEESRRIAQEAPFVRVLQQEETRGPGAARNRGALSALGDVLFFVDADVIVSPNALDYVRGFFAEHPGVDALIGSYDDAPADPHFLSQYRNLLHHYTHQTAAAEASTFWGACGAVRREAFLEAGGFDPDRYGRPCIEDIELGYRLKERGHRIRLEKNLQVKHLKRWRAGGMVRTDIWQRGVPWTRLLLERGTLPDDLNTDWRGRLSVAAAGLGAGALALVPWVPALALAVAGVAWLTLLVLNRRFYRFLARVRSVGFALRAAPWHAFYFLYSGFALAVGALSHVASRRRRVPARRPSKRQSSRRHA